MKITREIKTAILALVAIAVVIFGYNFMKGHNILNSSRHFYAVYDNVGGLSPSAKVTINGMKIGTVSDIGFLNENGQILITMEINTDFELSKNSVAQIYSGGFIGGKSVRIIPKDGGAPAQSGDTLVGNVKESMIESLGESLKPLQEKLQSAITGIDSLVVSFNNILDKEGQRNLSEAIAKFNSSMTHLQSTSAQIDALLANNSTKLDTTFTNLSKATYNFKNLSDSLAQIEVKPLIGQFKSVLNNIDEITTKLNEGKGTAGKLLNDDQVYENLDHASKQLEELIRDIKLHPRRYINLKFSIFGGKDKAKPYQKPDDPLK